MILGSPWLHERIRTRPSVRLFRSEATDVCVVGGGIAGIATAYELLTTTQSRVTLIEAVEVGAGASGNNAGQLLAHFERSTLSLISEYGEEMTKRALQELDSSWELLSEMVTTLNIKTPIHPYSGATGYKDMKTLLARLEEVYRDVGMSREVPSITVLPECLSKIPPEYLAFVQVGTPEEIQSILHMSDSGFIATIRWRGAVSNSGMLVEEIADTLIKQFPMRFSLYEHSPVERIVITQRGARVFVGDNVIDADRVVLATNGSESFVIETTSGQSVNGLFHHSVNGVIGYMAAYIVEEPYEPMANAYFGVLDDAVTQKAPYDSSKFQYPYVYLTRRPYQGKTLIAIGGPEDWLDDSQSYNHHAPFPERASKEMRDAIRLYKTPLDREPDFIWHGLMGYTHTGIRVVGKDPRHEALWYNLGCNGVGLLPSLMGARRIAQLMRGDVLPRSVFDPH